jgi:hypothetical protein
MVYFEAFTAVVFQVYVFWVVTPCSVASMFRVKCLKMQEAMKAYWGSGGIAPRIL